MATNDEQAHALLTLVRDLVTTLNAENGPEQLDGYLDHLAEDFNGPLAALDLGLPLFVPVGEA